MIFAVKMGKLVQISKTSKNKVILRKKGNKIKKLQADWAV